MLASADVLLDASARAWWRTARSAWARTSLAQQFPSLITARITPFGDIGPWKDYKASDLIHLALGGVMMNCGYDPDPAGRYDLPPIAPQALARVPHRRRAGGWSAISRRCCTACARAKGQDVVVRDSSRPCRHQHRARPDVLGHAARAPHTARPAATRRRRPIASPPSATPRTAAGTWRGRRLCARPGEARALPREATARRSRPADACAGGATQARDVPGSGAQ
jgi:hypothetical protein